MRGALVLLAARTPARSCASLLGGGMIAMAGEDQGGDRHDGDRGAERDLVADRAARGVAVLRAGRRGARDGSRGGHASKASTTDEKASARAALEAGTARAPVATAEREATAFVLHGRVVGLDRAGTLLSRDRRDYAEVWAPEDSWSRHVRTGRSVTAAVKTDGEFEMNLDA
jgi:hypothetical protein